MATSLSLSSKAVLAGFVLDAAAVPLHWYYDIEKFKNVIGREGLKTPEFHSPMATEFYNAEKFPGHYAMGQLSCYGEQGHMTLKYLDKHAGKFEGGESFAQFLLTYFEAYDGYVDHPTKLFLEKAKPLKADNKALYPDAGADDNQTMFTFKVLPLMMLRKSFGADENKFLTVLEEATRAHQNKDICVDFAKAVGVMFTELQAGKTFGNVIEIILARSDMTEQVKESVRYAWDRRSKAAVDADGWDASLHKYGIELSNYLFGKGVGTEDFKDSVGITCIFPGSFMAALKVVADTVEQFPDLESLKKEGILYATRRNILLAGDNCGRSFMVGGMLASMGCEIPDSLLEKLAPKDEIIGLLAKIEKMQG